MIFFSKQVLFGYLRLVKRVTPNSRVSLFERYNETKPGGRACKTWNASKNWDSGKKIVYNFSEKFRTLSFPFSEVYLENLKKY